MQQTDTENPFFRPGFLQSVGHVTRSWSCARALSGQWDPWGSVKHGATRSTTDRHKFRHMIEIATPLLYIFHIIRTTIIRYVSALSAMIIIIIVKQEVIVREANITCVLYHRVVHLLSAQTYAQGRHILSVQNYQRP